MVDSPVSLYAFLWLKFVHPFILDIVVLFWVQGFCYLGELCPGLGSLLKAADWEEQQQRKWGNKTWTCESKSWLVLIIFALLGWLQGDYHLLLNSRGLSKGLVVRLLFLLLWSLTSHWPEESLQSTLVPYPIPIHDCLYLWHPGIQYSLLTCVGTCKDMA